MEKLSISLTPSQDATVIYCMKLLTNFKIIVLQGKSGSGKHIIAEEIFRRSNIIVELFDLYEIIKSPQHIMKYFDDLVSKFQSSTTTNKRRKIDSIDNDVISTSLSQLSIGKLDTPIKRNYSGIIYIRHYDEIIKIHPKFSLMLSLLHDSLPSNVKILITSVHQHELHQRIHWHTNINTTSIDIEHILRSYYDTKIISMDELLILKDISGTLSPGDIIYCMNYAIAMSHKGFSIEVYIVALRKFIDIPRIHSDIDLIGIEEIVEEMNSSVITPINVQIHGLRTKKGLVICGPTGSGKTSIGKWLQRKINDKFYFIDIKSKFKDIIVLARDNSPSVVYVDDCDLLFEHEDIYKTFLTLFDDINRDICVIITCTNIHQIPLTLFKADHLEIILTTKLPDKKKISIVLERSLNTMIKNLHKEIDEFNTDQFITNYAIKMIGFNYTDIQQCIDELSRLLITNKKQNINILFDRCLNQIRNRYNFCQQHIDHYNSYIG